MRKLGYVVLVCTIVLTLQAVFSRGASANGAPIKIVLTYLPGVSNWGPTNASGAAEVVKKEGIVRLNVVGLPSLENDVYWAWITNTRNGESLSVGPFNTDKSGVAVLEVELPAEIPDKEWNLFLLTAETKGQTPAVPGARKSIGGFFPDSVEARQLPAQLPRTGGDTGSVVATPVPTIKEQSAPQAKSTPKVFDGLTLGVVGLVAVVVGVFTRAKMRNRRTRS